MNKNLKHISYNESMCVFSSLLPRPNMFLFFCQGICLTAFTCADSQVSPHNDVCSVVQI